MPTIDGKEVRIVVNSACVHCGRCVSVCPCEYLELQNGRAAERKTPAMGCITCGQCAAICPAAAIHVESKGISRQDVLEFSTAKAPSYEELFRLLSGRRSIRVFEDKPVSAETVAKILEAAQQAPAGIPPSTVMARVLDGKDRVRAFAFDFLDETARMSWLFSNWGIWALRPMMSANQHRDMRNKVVPLYRSLIAGRKEEKDFLFYDAPLAMLFLSREGDPVDPTIAATYAMVAAESMGLGSCMIGTVAPMLPSTRPAFLRKYKIPADAKQGLGVIFGYPKFKFRRGVRRCFEDIVSV